MKRHIDRKLLRYIYYKFTLMEDHLFLDSNLRGSEWITMFFLSFIVIINCMQYGAKI
jgi:hypothetical protein